MASRKKQGRGSERISVCDDCPDGGDVRMDLQNGKEVCVKCGLVAKSRIIDDSNEWRSFSKDDDKKGPQRAEMGSNDALLGELALGTYMGRVEGAPQGGFGRHNGGDDHRLVVKLNKAFSRISEAAVEFNFNMELAQRAKEVYVRLFKLGLTKSRRTRVVITFCLFAACRLLKAPRSLDEMSKLSGVPRRDIGKLLGQAKKMHALRGLGSTTGHAKQLVERFCQNVSRLPVADGTPPRPQVPYRLTLAAEEIATNADKIGVCTGRLPQTVAAAAIYLASELHESFRATQADIAAAASISAATVQKAYEELLEKDGIVPAGYASPDRVADLRLGNLSPSVSSTPDVHASDGHNNEDHQNRYQQQQQQQQAMSHMVKQPESHRAQLSV